MKFAEVTGPRKSNGHGETCEIYSVLNRAIRGLVDGEPSGGAEKGVCEIRRGEWCVIELVSSRQAASSCETTSFLPSVVPGSCGRADSRAKTPDRPAPRREVAGGQTRIRVVSAVCSVPVINASVTEERQFSAIYRRRRRRRRGRGPPVAVLVVFAVAGTRRARSTRAPKRFGLNVPRERARRLSYRESKTFTASDARPLARSTLRLPWIPGMARREISRPAHICSTARSGEYRFISGYLRDARRCRDFVRLLRLRRRDEQYMHGTGDTDPWRMYNRVSRYVSPEALARIKLN